MTAGHGRDFLSNQNNLRSKLLCNDELLWEIFSTKSLKIELQHELMLKLKTRESLSDHVKNC